MLVLDLVKQTERREREVIVGREYRRAVEHVNSTMPPVSATSVTDDIPEIPPGVGLISRWRGFGEHDTSCSLSSIGIIPLVPYIYIM